MLPGTLTVWRTPTSRATASTPTSSRRASSPATPRARSGAATSSAATCAAGYEGGGSSYACGKEDDYQTCCYPEYAALGEGADAAGAEPDGTMAHFTPAPRAVWYERVVLVLYAQIKSVSAPSTTLRAFSWFPLAATLRVNVMVVFPPL